MDFIERFFGFSPDGGSGASEVLVFVALGLAVLLPALAYARRRTQRV